MDREVQVAIIASANESGDKKCTLDTSEDSPCVDPSNDGSAATVAATLTLCEHNSNSLTPVAGRSVGSRD